MINLSLIESNPGVLGGKIIFKNTRIAISMILKLLGEGRSLDKILENYPNLTKQHLYQAISYASFLTSKEYTVNV